MKSKKFLRRIFAILIAVIIACSSFATVGAATTWSSGSRGSKSYGIYWNKPLSFSYTDAQGKTKKVSYSNGQGFRVHFFAKIGEQLDFSKDKQRAFCIEPEKDVELTGDGSYTTNSDLSGVDAYNKKLSTAQQKVLNYVLAFGYGNYKSYTKYAYWYATQLLVYETAAGIRKTSDFTVASGKTAIKPTTYLGRNSGAEVGSIDTIQDAYDNIVGWVQKALKTPSGTSTSTSNAPTYSMSYDANKKVYTYTYKDSNKILRTTYKDSGDSSEKYSKQNLKASDITVSDSNVTFSIDNSKETITFTSKTALTSPVRVTIKNSYLRGASEMCQDKLSIAVAKGSSSLQAFARGATVTVPSVYFNLTVPIKLQLIKSSANTDITDNNNCYSLEGARYNIYTDKSCNAETSYFSYITTDSDGYGRYGTASDTNTDVNDKDTAAYKKVSGKNIELKSGVTYYAKEVEAPPGYDLDNTVYTFRDSGSISSDGVKIYRAYSDEGNQPADNPINDPVGIVLQKKNAVTGETTNQGLEGAIFEVQYYSQEIDKDYDVDTSKGDAEPTLDSANLKRTWYIKTNDIGFARLNTEYIVNNGTYTSDDLYLDNNYVTVPIGTVVIKEVKEPDGYTKTPVVFYRQITEDGAKNAQATGTPINIPVDEQPANAYIGIHKMNKSGQGVKGAVYGLYTDENATTRVALLTTDINGKGTFNYAAKVNQTYYIKEISAPTGYNLDTTIYPVTPTIENATVDTAVVQDIYEDSVKGDIIIKKSSNDGIVSNLYFALSDNLGNTYNAVATDSTGTAKHTGLPVYDSNNKKIQYTVKELGFKTTPGTKSYGGFTWTVKAENCIKYKGAYYEGVANNTFSDCEYAYSRYYYGNQTEAIQNSNGYTKTLTANSSVTYSFNNTVKTTDIEISKQSYDGRKSGFWFKVVDQTGKSYGEIVTNDNGIAKYSEQYSKPLYSCITVPNSGIALRLKYRVEELGLKNPGSGTYYLPDTYIEKVVTDYKSDNLSTSTPISFDIYNKPDTGSLNIVKSSDDGYIANLWFKVSAYINWADEDEEPDYESTYIGCDANGSEINEFYLQTDSSGKASSDSLVFYDSNGNQMTGLPVYVYGMTDYEITYIITELGLKDSDGTYYLPDRYEKNEDVYFNLLENRSYTYTCHNSVKKGKLQIQKTSEDNEVDNIWFKVESSLGYMANFITDSTGFTNEIEDLPIYVPATNNNELVTYKVTELGYLQSDGSYEIPFRYNTPKSVTVNLNTDGTVTIAHITNLLKTGSVTLLKKDSDGNALTGSQWELHNASDDSLVSLVQTGNGQYQYNDNGKIVILDTDNNGRLKVSNLKQGDYYFSEKTPPDGKMTYGKKIEFTISADSDETLNLTYTAIDDNIVMYDTGGNGLAIIYITAFIMLAISIAIFVFYNKKYFMRSFKNDKNK